jgi:hypothetical protein
MKLFRVTIALALLGLFAGCGEPQVDLSTTKTHRSGAITFDYPKNWEISDDSLTPEIHYLFVETPGDALVVFQSYPIDEANGLTDFSKAFSKSAATETPIGKVVQSTFSAIPEASGYEWIEEEFSIKFLSESIPHRRLYGTKMIGDRHARAEPGFELIRNSLRSIQEAEQDGADQPATVLKSKSEGKEKPTTESKVRSQ